jgi:hypothetical protein
VNGRTLLTSRPSAFISVALIASAVAFSSSAAAQGETPPATPPTPAPPATAPTAPTAPATPATDTAAPDAKKADEEAEKKKQQQGEPGAPGAPATGAPATAAPDQKDQKPAEPAISVSIGSDQPRKDEIKVDTKKKDDEEQARTIFDGSTFFWDHSVSTQTFGMGQTPQSYVPLYEWWFSFRPIITFKQFGGHRLQYVGRADMTKELTNNQDTKDYRENVFGDLWNTLKWSDVISERLKHTKYSIGVNVKLPTSKESQARGVYFKPGASLGLAQDVPINGESAKFFPGAKFKLSQSYEHPIARATTPTEYNNFEQTGQDATGETRVTNQISGIPLPTHTLVTIGSAGVSITEKLTFGLTGIFVNNWSYGPKENAQVRTDTGMVTVPPGQKATVFSQGTWFLASLDYDVIDEFSVGIGYFNIAALRATDGQNRGIVGRDNIWWSPDARVSATFTANLDKLYERAIGMPKEDKKEEKKAGALAPPGHL